jgi:hypothetical protein
MYHQPTPGRNADDEGWRVKAMELLGSGRTKAARDLVQQRLHHDAFARLVTLDGAVRRHQAGPADIEQVRRLIADDVADDPRLGWWLQALLADRLLLDGDFEGMAEAAAVLGDVPPAPLTDLLTLFVRGRLRRSLGLARVGIGDDPTDGPTADHRALWAGSVEDFRRCGFGPEAAVTRALFAGMLALLRWDDPETNLQHVIEARAEVYETCDAEWCAWIDFIIGLIAILLGDPARTREAGRNLAARLGPSSPFTPVGPCFDALAGLMDGTDDPDGLVVILDRCLDALRGVLPRLVPMLQLQAANVLGDRGHPAAARLGVAALDAPTSRTADEGDNELMAWRVDAARGVVGTSTDVEALLAGLEERGDIRTTAPKALRLAQDYRRLGALADAEALRRWGLDHLPTDRERAFWDARWADPSVAPPPGRSAPAPPSRAAGMTLRVLSPVLELLRDDRSVTVRPAVARLLLVLVLAHPTPVHVEQAVDQLWPDLALDTARHRLNTTIHRLRRLFPGDEAAVRRRGDVMQFEPNRLDVDLLHYRARVRGDPAEQAAAVVSVRGNLCHVQFPYDEVLVQHRRELASQWSRLARRLLAGGTLELDDLGPVLDSLDVADAFGVPRPA